MSLLMRLLRVRQPVPSGPILISPTIRARVYLSLKVRPWLTDIGCGLSALIWGIWVSLHTREVAHLPDFMRFRENLPELAGLIAVLGFLQLAAALLKHQRGRQVAALGGMIFWSGIAVSLHYASGQAMYTNAALFDALILIRAF